MQFSDILVKNALFCDETEDYRTPAEPEAGDSVVIRFRTLANNVDNVYLISRKSEIKMEKVRTEGLFDFYETQISVGSTSYLYYFEIEKGRDICYYNKLGCTTNLRQKYAFRITPGFHTPEWAKGAVFYRIYVDRFYNADPSNDVLSGEYYYVGSQSERVLIGIVFRQILILDVSTEVIFRVCAQSLTIYRSLALRSSTLIRCLSLRLITNMIFRIMIILIRILQLSKRMRAGFLKRVRRKTKRQVAISAVLPLKKI